MIYGFLCASLPVLECGNVPELSLAEFDALAAEAMSAHKYAKLTAWDDPQKRSKVDIYRKMDEFDRFLKLRIAEARQEKLGVFSELPLPEEFHTDVDFALPAAASADDPLERERMVDLIRWRKIDDLECGHELDFEYLCCYRMRLAAMQKYRKRAANDGAKLFGEAVDRLSGPISNL